MIPDEAVKAAALAMAPVAKGLEATILAQAALTAAAPFLRAQALEDAADVLARSTVRDPLGKATFENYAEWLRARAVTERLPADTNTTDSL